MRLLKEKQNHGRLTGNVATPDPISMRDENCRSLPLVFTSSYVTPPYLVDEYDFIFREDACGWNFVSRWHLLCPDDSASEPVMRDQP